MPPLAFEKDLPEAITRADDLPSLPTVAVEVLRLAQDENSTLDELAQCLSRDPALAAKLLRLANSSMFDLGHEVTTLQRATMVLGLKTVKLMALSFSLVGSVPHQGRLRGFDYLEYWRRSIVRSVAARALARLTGSPLVDEAFLCGLLAHFGRLVLARLLPEDYEELAAESDGWPRREREEEALGVSSTDLCATLLKRWNAPEVLYLATGYAERPEELPADAPEGTRELARLLAHAERCERILCDAEKGPSLEQLARDLGADHGVGEDDLRGFLLGLESGVVEVAELLSIRLPAGASHGELLERARAQIVQVGLGTAAALQRTSQERDRLALENERLASRATTDALTGLANRATFEELLAEQVGRRLRGPEPLALGLVLIDIDHFKRVNDTWGHAAGDEVLRAVAEVLRSGTRRGDLAARYGGEEFALLAPHASPTGLRGLCERLRGAIAALAVPWDGEELCVTASLGAACVVELLGPADGRKLVRLADSLLYRAKEAGRDRCEVHRHPRFPGG